MSKLDHMLLVASTAKALAHGKPVTAQHLMVADTLVRRSPKHALILIKASRKVGVSGLFDKLKKGLGIASKFAPVLSPTTSLAIQAMKYANARKTKPASISDQTTSADVEHIMGVACCGEEEAALAASGGGAERDALMRRSTIRGSGKPPFYFPAFITAGAVPNDIYRATVWRRACLVSKKAGGGRPQAKDIMLAQKATDWDLRRKGISVSIPGAKPGRRTK